MFRRIFFSILSMVLASGVLPAQETELRVFTVNPDALARVKSSNPAKNKEFKSAYGKLIRDAAKALSVGPWSVIDKAQTPSSGDKHDYLSLARYFWPNPDKPDGLPYVQRDGETNPETETITDYKYFGNVEKSLSALGLAYYFTGEEKYAEKAALLLRTWFLDPKTKMNPNLNFGQVVKGKEGGRPSGLIEMRGLAAIVDGIGLLAGSKAWTADDQRGMKEWFEKYAGWLATSEIAKKEIATKNNHGVWIDVQRASIALFLGKKEFAVNLLNEAKANRIAEQIEPDGQQARELARTRSLHYTFFNLEAMFALASVGERAGVDLWNYQSADGRSIRKALDWVLPYAMDEKKWEHEQIDEIKMDKTYDLFRQAALKFNDERYMKAAEEVASDDSEKDRSNLFYPKEK